MNDIVKEIWVGIITQGIFVVGVLLFTIIILFLKYSNTFRYFRKFKHPEKRVFIFEEHTDLEVEMQPNTEFNKKFLDDTERRTLVSLFGSRNNACPFDGESIRLDKLSIRNNQAYLQVSVVGFFDFLSTNLSVYPANAPVTSISSVIRMILKWWGSFEIIGKLKDRVKTYGKINNGTDVLKIKEFANILAVSVLIEDMDGNVLLLERSTTVAISSGAMSVSSAGSVDVKDFCDDGNPILNCAIREVNEELGFLTDELEYSYGGIVIAMQKMQPVILYYAKLNQSFSEVVSKMRDAPDFHEENSQIYIVPRDKVALFIAHSTMSDAASYQLYLYLKRNNRSFYWLLALVTPVNKTKYLAN